MPWALYFPVGLVPGGAPIKSGPSRLGASATAANEVYDLQAITFGELGVRPTIARHDITVQFNRYTVLLHAKLLDQSRQCERSFEIARLAVDLDGHCIHCRKLKRDQQGCRRQVPTMRTQASTEPDGGDQSTLRSWNFLVAVRSP